MRLMGKLSSAFLFVSEAFFEIFTNTDDYPATGMQSFTGDKYSRWVSR